MTWIVAASLLALATPVLAQETQPSPPPPPVEAPMAGAAPGVTSGEDPIGGYQPATAPMAPPAGARIVFQPSPSVEQAYPPPAPLKSYPICKKGQYDNCRQRGG